MVKVSIEIRGPNLAPELREFSQTKIVVGRETGHIVLADPQASSQHAEINVTPAYVTFVDLNSTNGSYLADGQRITQPLSLSVGTEVRIGSCSLILRGVESIATGPRGTLVMPQTDRGSVPGPAAAPTAGGQNVGGGGFAPVGGAGAAIPGPGVPFPAPTTGPWLGVPDGRAVVSSGVVDDPLAATYLAGSPQASPGAGPGLPSAGSAWQPPAAAPLPGAGYPQQSPGQPAQPPMGNAPGPGFSPPYAAQPGGYQQQHGMGQPYVPPGQGGQIPGGQVPGGQVPGAPMSGAPMSGAPMPGGPAAGYAGGAAAGFGAAGGYGGAPPGPPPGAAGHPGQWGAPPGGGGVVHAGAAHGGSDPVGFAKACFEAYKPHFAEATKVLGILAVPLGVLNAVSGYIPVVGWLLALLGGIGYAVAYFFFGYGAQAEYAMRLAAGTPISAGVAWKTQLRRMFPWIFGLVVPLIGSMVLCLISVILWGLFVLPAYMVEDKKMFDANKRSFELASKDWVLSIVPMLLIAVPAVILSTIVTVVLGFIPYVGDQLAAIWGPVFSAALTPLLTFVQFRVYFALRLKHEGIDATVLVRNKAA